MDDKNYLGLGVIFRAVDDGFTKNIDKATKKAKKAQKILNDVGSVKIPDTTPKFSMSKERKQPYSYPIEGFKGKVPRGAPKASDLEKPLAQQKALSALIKNNITGAFSLGKALAIFANPFEKLLSGTGKVSDLAVQLDKVQTKMGIVYGAEQAKKFNAELINSVRNFGMTADQVGDVANKLNQWGVPIERSNKLLPTMSKLIGVMGMDAGTVADMFGTTTQRLGMSVEGSKQLVEEMYSLGRAQGFVDFLEDLPGVVQSVYASFNKLGMYNTKAAKATVQQTMALSAMYRKMGIDQKAAVEAAKKVQQAATQMTTDIRRMQVGLDPENFEGMIDVASEMSRVAGMGFEDTLDLMKKGPEEVQKKMMDISKSLSGDDLFRFSEVMRKQFGDEFAMALRDPNAAKAAKEAGKVVGKSGKEASKQMEDAVSVQSETFENQQKLLETNIQLVQALGELSGKAGIIAGWQAQIQGLQKMQDALLPFTELFAKLQAAGFSAFFPLAGVLGGVIKSLEVLGSLIGYMPRIFSKMWDSLKVLTKVFTDFGTGIVNTAKSIGSKFLKLGNVFKIFGKMGAKALGPIGAAFGFIQDGMDAVKEKSFSAKAGTLLFGKNPEKDIKSASIAAGLQAAKWAAVGATVGSFIPGLGTLVGGLVGAGLGAASSFIKTYWDDIVKSTSGLVKWISDSWTSIWSGIKNTFSSGVDWIKNAFNGTVDVLGKLFKSIGSLAGNVWDGLKSGFSSAIDWIKSTFMSAVKWIGDVLKSIPGISTLMNKASGMFSSNQPSTAITPIQAQEEAPKISRVASYEPKFKEKDTGNTLDDVVKALVDLRDMIRSLSTEPKPIQVVLEGDAKKLFKVVQNESGNRVSVAGLSNALGGAY